MSSDSRMTYDLSDPLEFDALTAVRPGSNILISGPAMTGKDELALSILADGSREGQGAVVMTTSERAEDVAEDYRRRVPDLDETQLAVVDCRSDGGRDDRRTPGGGFLYRVSAPSDMTGIGIGITKGMETLANNGADGGRFALTSLSTMLTYTDQQTVFKFCHVLSSKFDTAEYVSLFTVDSTAHDDQTLQVLKQAFDGMIEIREGEDGREARVRGLSANPTDWQSF